MMFKKIFLPTFFLLQIFSTKLYSMEDPKPIVQVVYAPTYDGQDDEYEIKAFDKEGSNIAYIYYKPILKNTRVWIIRELWVKSDCRNQGLGFKILNACFEHIKQQKATKIMWLVNPCDSTLDRYQTANIYFRMLKKINKDDGFQSTFETSSKLTTVSVVCEYK